ncbi:phosphoglycerate dehydrogenase [Roseovarius indicus]|uniref:phosphoglycerate dehydrogenase n=1 Tax=Roseovarius indicus TaxID=540747 RepID=UPI0013748074|nr:phosphoglycerate dehydrogenase [Roseovarius indicus]
MIKERDRFDKEIRDRGYEPIWVDVEQFLAEDRCLDLVGDIDGWLAGDDQITRAVLEKALPRLKVIAKWGTGIDSIDSASAKELGVPVLNAPGAFADAVAEVAIGLILMVTRHLGRIDREIRTGGWPKPQGLELKNSTLGMIGYGAIGRRIGELGAAFGMNVRFSDPFIDGSESVAEVARAADVLCLACALTPENHHLVNADLLKTMKPGAIVANVARGPLVDTKALVEALQSGHLGGAALDVFEDEPLPADHPLLGFDNVVVSSHNANNGRGAVEAVHARTLSNLDSVIG